MTFSDEVGVRKPAAEIFADTLRRVGGDAASAVHVGDDEILDVDGARKAGLRVVQVVGRAATSPGSRRIARSRVSAICPPPSPRSKGSEVRSPP